MWEILNGTLVNTGTVALGTSLGLAIGPVIPERFQRIVLTCLGLITIMLGVDAGPMTMQGVVREFGRGIQTYGARVGLVVIASLIVGALIGTALKLHERLEGLGETIHRRFGKADMAAPGEADHAAARRFAEGFLTASVIFCVGPLTLLGCLQNGASGDPTLLYIKAVLDGFCSMALAATLGWGVALSIVTVLVFQGGLSLVACAFAGGLPPLSRDLMNVVGGLMLLATALSLLDIKKIPVANLLPGLFLPPLIVWCVERAWPGLLM
ncbi:MAG: DUF554 domain-containing protein [Phycisphaerales bacterium]|nr:DUF554 domain-containing protein [Phycisphaerales bacterium]